LHIFCPNLLPNPNKDAALLPLYDLPIQSPDRIPFVINRDDPLNRVAYRINKIYSIATVVGLLHEDVYPNPILDDALTA